MYWPNLHIRFDTKKYIKRLIAGNIYDLIIPMKSYSLLIHTFVSLWKEVFDTKSCACIKK